MAKRRAQQAAWARAKRAKVRAAETPEDAEQRRLERRKRHNEYMTRIWSDPVLEAEYRARIKARNERRAEAVRSDPELLAKQREQAAKRARAYRARRKALSEGEKAEVAAKERARYNKRKAEDPDAHREYLGRKVAQYRESRARDAQSEYWRNLAKRWWKGSG